jgi:hypothetical protein
MENKKINIAELLKYCPKGMELDCSIWDNVVFDHVDMKSYYPIYVKKMGGKIEFLTEYGCFNFDCGAKCVIFPKGKTTWEDFVPPYKFKDGDVCYVKTRGLFEFIFIFKVSEDNIYIQNYVSLSVYELYTGNGPLCATDDIREIRLATEEEKQKLFCAIKDNGYKWNTNTKTLEKLIKPKFKVGDIIQDIIGICNLKITEVNIEDEYYLYKSLNINGIGGISFNRQDDWELVPTKFDITTLVPFESRVLVRHNIDNKWCGSFFSHIDGDFHSHCYKFVTIAGKSYPMCIPYEGNEHLLGTTNDCIEYYKTWQ